MMDKRNIAEVATPQSDHEDKKHTKPGRKPIDTEPKLKRTAQNRAAQRAYRERKERKMKDLEDKVKALEDETIKANTETDFLRAQVEMLKTELARYRGHSDFSDLKLPTKVGHLSNPQGHKRATPELAKSSPATDVSNRSLSSSFPWSKDNLNLFDSSPLDLKDLSLALQKGYAGVPDLIAGGLLSSTSPLNDNILVSPELNDSGSNPHTVNLQQFGTFDEQIDPFCTKLNEACGTKQCPIPKAKISGYENDQIAKLTSLNAKSTASPFTTLVGQTPNSQEPFFSSGDYNIPLPADDNYDPLSFLNDNQFDVSLAFADNLGEPKKEEDPIARLTTEELAYEMLDAPINTNFNFNEFVRSSLPSELTSTGSEDPPSSFSLNTSYNSTSNLTKLKPEDDDEVVPAPEKTVTCSEIWDRITSHPKYTEIDIDGLCNELKSKAKCSERGVVLNPADVNRLLEKSTYKK